MSLYVFSLKDYCINSLSNSNINIFKYQFINKKEHDQILYNRKHNDYLKYAIITKDQLSKYKWITTWKEGLGFSHYFYQYRIKIYQSNGKLIILRIKNKAECKGTAFSNPGWKYPYDFDQSYDEGTVLYYKVHSISEIKMKLETIRSSRLLDSLIDNMTDKNIKILNNWNLNAMPYRSFDYKVDM